MNKVMPSQAVAFIERTLMGYVNNPTEPIQPQIFGELSGLLALVEQIPDAVIAVDPADYVNLTLACSTLKSSMNRSDVMQNTFPNVRGAGNRNAVAVIHGVLSVCPDEMLSPETSALQFIDDPQLRASIRSDVGASHRALLNAEWKATTVLAGSAIEALFHWKLQDRRLAQQKASVLEQAVANGMKRPSSDLDRWDLELFIEISAKLELISPDTQTAARLAKNYRNLIHPGRAARLNQTCNRATAYSAVGALEAVINDLERNA